MLGLSWVRKLGTSVAELIDAPYNMNGFHLFGQESSI